MTYTKEGLKTVNCGSLFTWNNSEYELLSSSLSGHRDNIICKYVKGSFYPGIKAAKLEFIYCINENGNEHKSIAFFNDYSELQAYKHMNYSDKQVPAAYVGIFEELKEVYKIAAAANQFYFEYLGIYSDSEIRELASEAGILC